MVARGDRAIDVLELIAVLLDGMQVVEIGLPADSQDQIVIADHGAVHADEPGVEVDGCHFAHLEGEIVLMAKDAANGVRDLGGDQAGDSHLVEKRLEEVVILPVDHGDPNGSLGEFPGSFHSSEAGADNQDMRQIFSGHVSL